MFDPQELQQEIFTVSKELSKFPLISTRTCGLQQRVGNVEELFLWHFTLCSQNTFPENEKFCSEFRIGFASVISEV